MGSKRAPKGSVNSVGSVRERPHQRERKNSTKYASSLIGVTSHTTPLSIRRGVGGEAAVSSVREKYVLCERKICTL